MKKTTLAAISKYGREACVKAYWQNIAGEGASTIAITGPSSIRTTRQADAAINAGEEIALAEDNAPPNTGDTPPWQHS
jgi:hypothetical protein